MSSVHPTTELLPGLDQDNNPDMSQAISLRNSPVRYATAIRNVDWRWGPEAITSGIKFRAAYGQRCGMVVPEGQECDRCKRGNGVFPSCVVSVAGGLPQAKGACMNCVWHNAGYRCSFRTGSSMPDWLVKYVQSLNPTFIPPVNREPSSSPSNLPSSQDVAVSATPNATSSSPPRMHTTQTSPISPYSTGMGDMLTAEWYTSPLEHLELHADLNSMHRIRRELLTARQKVDQDISWLTAEIQKTEEASLRDLLSTVTNP